jgi:putative ABC transport system substrate-binding protein
MKRREFVTAFGAAIIWPFAARAQKTERPTIGFLNGSSATAYAAYVQAFIRGLTEAGYKVGENVAIEYRWADGHYERIPEMANDLVSRALTDPAEMQPA